MYVRICVLEDMVEFIEKCDVFLVNEGIKEHIDKLCVCACMYV